MGWVSIYLYHNHQLHPNLRDHPNPKNNKHASITLPETNIAPENRPGPKGNLIFQPLIFRDEVSFREGFQGVLKETLWPTSLQHRFPLLVGLHMTNFQNERVSENREKKELKPFFTIHNL